MITRTLIKDLYKKYKKPPKSVDLLNLALLFDYASRHHDIYIDPEAEELHIGSIDPDSPFHKLSIPRINAIVPFEQWIAIVMPASIIFLNRNSNEVAVDIKDIGPSILDRLRGIRPE